MKILFVTFLVFSGISYSQQLQKLIEKNNFIKLEKFLNGGGDINAKIDIPLDYIQDESYPTTSSPLAYAVSYEYEESVRFFIANKAKNPNFQEELTEAFILSLSRKNDGITDMLYAENPDFSLTCGFCHNANALMIAASYGLEEWYFKLKPSCDLQFISKNNMNLLHYAASSPSEKIAEDILSIEGLDPNLMSLDSTYAIGFAAANHENLKVFQALIDYGAKPELQEDLFEFAIEGTNLVVLDYLLNNTFPMDLFKLDSYTRTFPLEFSAMQYRDSSGELVYVTDQDKFCIKLMNACISEINALQIEEEEYAPYWDMVLDGSQFYNVMILSLDFDNITVLEKYYELVGTLQNHAPSFYLFPKKYYKSACKFFDSNLIDELYDKYNIDLVNA